jgi:hypothetical protein
MRSWISKMASSRPSSLTLRTIAPLPASTRRAVTRIASPARW